MAKPAAYEEVYKYLEQHPILRWACKRTGISTSAVREMAARKPAVAERIEQAKAIGQGKLLPHVSAERVLAWSDPKTFGLKQQIEHGGQVAVPVSAALAERLCASATED